MPEVCESAGRPLARQITLRKRRLRRDEQDHRRHRQDGSPGPRTVETLSGMPLSELAPVKVRQIRRQGTEAANRERQVRETNARIGPARVGQPPRLFR